MLGTAFEISHNSVNISLFFVKGAKVGMTKPDDAFVNRFHMILEEPIEPKVKLV